MRYDLEKSSHAVYSLHYHLILVVKYRREIFTNKQIVDELKRRVKGIAPNHSVTILNQEVNKDHIYILFTSEPTTNLAKFVNALKTGTSKAIRHRFGISDKLQGDAFWSGSYCLVSTGEATLDQLKQYVENQGK